MTKLFVAACAAVLLTGAGCLSNGNDNNNVLDAQAEIPGVIVVDSPKVNATIASPVTVTGEAVGNWFFEASFPIQVKDDAGNVIGVGIAEAQGDWMTTEMVPFEAEIVFDSGNATEGKMVLKKDNPSGLPEYEESLEFPVQFSE